MAFRKKWNIPLVIVILLSFAIKLVLILIYQNRLTLNSDDLNYIKSAEVLVRKGMLIYYDYNDPTVFIMPLYPLFLAAVFKIFGWGLMGIQAVRIIQAVLSCTAIWLVYMTGKELFNHRVAFLAAVLTAFYVPNITSVGYMLTETVFTFLLCLLLYLSLRFASMPTSRRFAVLGLVWALTTLVRPTIALYPVLLFFYLFVRYKYSMRACIRTGTAMLAVFIIIMSPWWIRSYREYGTFIPLSASSGNPMLQGTYVDYKQTPENIVYYRLGKNSYETNQIEVETAKKRMAAEFKKDPLGYLKWYTLGKTAFFWGSAFYWKPFFHIPWGWVLVYHYVLLLGFFGVFFLLFRNFSKYILPISILAYFNAVHCLYMAFDRYAFPLMHIMAVFSAYTLYSLYLVVRKNAYVAEID